MVLQGKGCEHVSTIPHCSYIVREREVGSWGDSCLKKIPWKSDDQYGNVSLFIQTRKDDDKERENVIRIGVVAERTMI